MSSVPPFGSSPGNLPQGQPGASPVPQGSGLGGFFGALFDFSFTKFITRKALAIIWGIVIIVYALGALAYLAIGLSQGGLLAFATLIVVPVATLLGLVFWRLALEFLVIQFRQADLLEQIAAKN